MEPLDSVEADLDSVLEVPDSVALDSMQPPDSVEVVPDSVEEAPDSVEELLDSVESVDDVVTESVEDVVSTSVDVVPDSVEDAPDDDVVVHCPRCGTFHAGGVFGEACFQARRNARRCARCGLLHEDYDLPVRFFHLMDKFDCEFYIPDVDKLVMDGDRIYVTDEVRKKLEEHIKKQQAKTSKVHASHSFFTAYPKIHSSSNLHLLLCFRKSSKCFG